MEFRILGSLEAEADGDRLTLSGPSVRKALALLLLDANRVVPLSRLVDGLWDEDAPDAAVKQARNAVGRLRRVLAVGGTPETIVTDGAGYRILVARGALDAELFETEVTRARRAASEGRIDVAAGLLREALGLWRGPFLAGMRGRVIEEAAAAWTERRDAVTEMYYDYQLESGHHHEVVAELSEFASGHPLRERPAGQLMLALYRCGRQADALAHYDRTRRLLADELGVDPGTELRLLHQRMLRADAALLTTGQRSAHGSGLSEPAVHQVPRQLPAAVADFTGRATELAALTGILDEAGVGAPGTVVISAIGGTAGIGKTALALYWAHQVAGRFGDGQLYVNLRGFAPSGAPLTPPEAVRGFLAALGVPPERIPSGPDARAALYRSMLAERKMLIVLDNARDEHQVRPLLPASPASLVIVTSRNQLAGLAAADGARLVTLDILSHDEAVELLTVRIGAHRAAAEPGAVDEIAALCAGLPLALAVAAARATARPRFPLMRLAAELRGAADRTDVLDALDAGDPAINVRAVFSWSYRQLSTAAARMFRLLGLHPGPDISIRAAASLAAVDEPQARRLLHELARDCLITEHAPGRYAFHDLLRAYATDKGRECDSESDRDAAVGRVLDHYLHTAGRACLLLRPAREPIALTPPRPGTCPEQPGDHQQALAWFEAEHHVLLAAVTLAADIGADSHAWQLPWAMTDYLYRRGSAHERVAIMGSALAAATRQDDALGQAMSLCRLGNAYVHTGDYDQARAHLERGLSLFQRLNDRRGEAAVQQSLSALAEAQGRYADGLTHAEQAVRLHRAIGHQAGEAEMLNGVAWFHVLLGDYQRARAFCEQSLALIAKLGGCHFEGFVWDTLGYAELHLGNFAQAATYFEFALDLCQEDGNRSAEAEILTHIGDARHASGELPRARQAWQEALAIYDDIQHPYAEKVRAKLRVSD
jgi:DNA-binding SARP family transcriptional activator/tetratricopeptide (TPR) repeat protein